MHWLWPYLAAKYALVHMRQLAKVNTTFPQAINEKPEIKTRFLLLNTQARGRSSNTLPIPVPAADPQARGQPPSPQPMPEHATGVVAFTTTPAEVLGHRTRERQSARRPLVVANIWSPGLSRFGVLVKTIARHCALVMCNNCTLSARVFTPCTFVHLRCFIFSPRKNTVY